METELHLAQQKLRMRLIRMLFPLKNAVLPLLAVGLLLAACSDDPTSPDSDPEPDPDPITVDAAFTITPEEPSIGETVTLDAGSSSVSGSTNIEYSWTLSAPGDSNAELDDPTSSTTTFEADVAGDFEVTLEVSAEGESDSASMGFEVRAVEEIDGNITADKTLFSEVLYLVTSSVSVSATLTIEPGTTIEFQQDTGMQIGEEGILIADGTAQDSIRFTAAEETPGYWDGLSFNGSQSTNNLLNHVIIEYGGGSGYWSAQDLNANLMVGMRTSSGDSRVELRNSTLRHSAGVGLKIRLGSSMPNSENNNYTANSEGPVFTEAPLIHYLSSNSDFTGNGNDYVLVSDKDVEGDNRTWNALNVPYRMNGNFSVSDIDLTIAAGTNFEFTNGSSLVFHGEGVFLVDGNRDDEVLFTGTEKTPGWWNGIQLNGARNPNNLMRHAVIEYGGGGNMHDFSNQDVFANLLIGGRTSGASSRLSVQNSTFRHSPDYGLKISGRGGGSHMPDAGSNTYTDNAKGAAFTQTNSMRYFASSSDFTGNGSDYVVITTRLSDSSLSGVEQTWSRLNVPYRMIAIEDRAYEISDSDADVTIEAGAEFHFASKVGLSFGENSSIHAVGTEDDPIIFTGTEEVEGWWSGIQISSLSPDNRIEHANFYFGGSDNGFSNWSTQSDFANLLVGGRTDSHAGRLHAENNLFANSEGYGIKTTADSHINDDVCDVNDFEVNNEGECLIKQ